jgi:thiol:disulfide interchange protein DsbD
VLGLISSLVVGACVSPILILTLGAAISKGDPVLGSAIMSAMALGMGSLLILVGFGAGWILPRAGAWMQHVQTVFGFMVLGVAIYIAGFLDQVPVLYLWAALLLWAGYYVYQFAREIRIPLLSSAIQALSVAVILWGGMALVGATTGGKQILAPLQSISMAGSGQRSMLDKIPLKTVTTLSAAQELLDQAKAANQPVMVDFYADWCLDCKRMAQTTFKEPDVHTALAGWELIEVDVTDTNKDSEELKRFFDVFGPPATLFIGPDGMEFSDLRQYGYMDKDAFLSLVNQAKQNNHVSAN